VLTNNPASAAVLRRAGLSLVWQGAPGAQTSSAAGVEGQVWTDRLLSDEQFAWLVRNA
jgi:hypothetical protein